VNASPIFIAISIAILLVIAILVFFVNGNRKRNRLTHLAGLSFGFVLAGILFASDKFMGYILLGIGMVLALIDIFRKATNHHPEGK